MSPFSQVFGSFPYQVKTKQKVVALTFDDGPNEPYTSALLDILDRQKVKATFFMVGKCVERYPEIVKRVAQTGHTIGNHGWSHQFGRYFIEPSYRHQIDKTQVLINKTIGQTPALFRPPWLWRQPMLMTTVKQKGLQIVSGRFGHELEVFQPSAKIMAKRTLKKVRPGAIIIFHDGFDARGGNRHQTVEAVRLIIEELKRQGYQFVTVDQLLVIKAYS
ncbi:MAG TPA: polysaccharide deacetylase family protein [Candidatus Saccharimonadales bacterium]|nr:polysaccharide deacetylase family protein [Candidatus Saccharimonadales bacterium]